MWFLNVQLCDSERSNFCSASVQEDLPGFGRFVVHFMIQMSKVCTFMWQGSVIEADSGVQTTVFVPVRCNAADGMSSYIFS